MMPATPRRVRGPIDGAVVQADLQPGERDADEEAEDAPGARGASGARGDEIASGGIKGYRQMA